MDIAEDVNYSDIDPILIINSSSQANVNRFTAAQFDNAEQHFEESDNEDQPMLDVQDVAARQQQPELGRNKAISGYQIRAHQLLSWQRYSLCLVHGFIKNLHIWVLQSWL